MTCVTCSQAEVSQKSVALDEIDGVKFFRGIMFALLPSLILWSIIVPSVLFLLRK